MYNVNDIFGEEFFEAQNKFKEALNIYRSAIDDARLNFRGSVIYAEDIDLSEECIILDNLENIETSLEEVEDYITESTDDAQKIIQDINDDNTVYTDEFIAVYKRLTGTQFKV